MIAVIATVIAALAALLHVYIFLMESVQWSQPRVWKRLQINGMKKDFSWDRSAAEYVKVYKRVMAARRKTGPKAAGRNRASRSGI